MTDHYTPKPPAGGAAPANDPGATSAAHALLGGAHGGGEARGEMQAQPLPYDPSAANHGAPASIPLTPGGSVTLRSFNPSGNSVIDGIKLRADELTNFILANVGPSRERSIALTEIEAGAMWAVKSAALEANRAKAQAEALGAGAEREIPKTIQTPHEANAGSPQR